MAFELRVTFTGLCVFLIQEDCRRVAVIQPDCRLKGKLSATHPDGEPAVHHAGYLRFDYANLSRGSTAPEPVENPLDEVIHHFRNEELVFENLDAAEPMTLRTGLPAMERIAPDPASQPGQPELDCPSGEKCRLQLIDWTRAEAPLAMRTRFGGGTLEKSDGEAEWAFLPYGFPPGSEYRGEYATEVTWTRKVLDRDELTLSITPFSGSPTRKITLHPTDTTSDGRVILLKIANLCSDNPLEWTEFPTPKPAREDRDFKWFYQLFRDGGKPIKGMVPIPTLQGGAAGVENCIGVKVTVPTV